MRSIVNVVAACPAKAWKPTEKLWNYAIAWYTSRKLYVKAWKLNETEWKWADDLGFLFVCLFVCLFFLRGEGVVYHFGNLLEKVTKRGAAKSTSSCINFSSPWILWINLRQLKFWKKDEVIFSDSSCHPFQFGAFVYEPPLAFAISNFPKSTTKVRYNNSMWVSPSPPRRKPRFPRLRETSIQGQSREEENNFRFCFLAFFLWRLVKMCHIFGSVF